MLRTTRTRATYRLYQLDRLVELRGSDYVHFRLMGREDLMSGVAGAHGSRGRALQPPTYTNAWHELHTSSEEGILSSRDSSDGQSSEERYNARHYGVPGHQEGPYVFEDAWRGHDHEGDYYEDPRHWEV